MRSYLFQIKINICTSIGAPHGKTRVFSIWIPTYKGVQGLKWRIQKEQGIYVKDQALFYHGEELQNHLTIEHYEIEHKSFVVLKPK